MAAVLFVSKPIAPPWNDSGKNLVRDLARGLSRHRATLMVRGDEDPGVRDADRAFVYAPTSGGFAPALVDQARVFAHLATDRGHDLWHFFFAPNPKSCAAGRVSTLLRRKRSLHTISSAPRDVRAIVPQLFADVNVVLSRHTEQRFLEAGLSPERMRRIAPSIEPLSVATDAARREARAKLSLPQDVPLVLYPGDLEFGEGGRVTVDALSALSRRDTHLVMACRAKTAGARQAEAELRAHAEAAGVAASITWLGETPHIHALLSAADVVSLPSVDLYAKMDYPLVLLEAMSLGRPVIVARTSAAAELAQGDAARCVDASAEAVAAELEGLLDDAEAMRALGARAALAVQERYHYRVMARAYEAVYDTLLAM